MPTPTASPRTIRVSLLRSIVRARPRSAQVLRDLIQTVYGLTVPASAVCDGHVAPMQYVSQAILGCGRDLVVWACRGGAKTELGSVVAHLESLLWPGCQIRILGGSLDQSEKMYEYLLRKWTGPLRSFLIREPTARRTELASGSTIEVLTQSPRSVRGQRVHRLKCDEVDEFDPDVWRAAQFVTQSGRARDGRWIPARMDVFSTMHRPAGPMAALVDRVLDGRACRTPAGAVGRSSLPAPPHLPLLLKWCLWEVIERCTGDRRCSACPLWSDCGGRARRAEGYFSIDDALAQYARASREAWESEMLCLRPRTEGRVFASFDPAVHVRPVAYSPSRPLYRAIDFGYANPFVCLWVQVEGKAAAAGACGDVDLTDVTLIVLAEYVERERPISDHVRALSALDPGPVLATYADPAGWQRSDVTGTGPCQELARLGVKVRTPRAGILEGIELVRRLLKVRDGRGPGLVIDPSCVHLVRAFQQYHWAESGEGCRHERPAKDGADHCIDALRYLVTGLLLGRPRVTVRTW